MAIFRPAPKCRLFFCTKGALHEKELCLVHQSDMTVALMKHLPRSRKAERDRFLKTPRGMTWFVDWMRLVEATTLFNPHEGTVATFTSEPDLPRPLKRMSLAKPHPSPKSQLRKRK